MGRRRPTWHSTDWKIWDAGDPHGTQRSNDSRNGIWNCIKFQLGSKTQLSSFYAVIPSTCSGSFWRLDCTLRHFVGIVRVLYTLPSSLQVHISFSVWWSNLTWSSISPWNPTTTEQVQVSKCQFYVMALDLNDFKCYDYSVVTVYIWNLTAKIG